MAGTALTDAFMLGAATVMIGPQADLFDLNPSQHSIGLVKNFSMTSEPQYTELTQGVKNTIVMSVMTQNPVRATMEVYEYTAKNLAYGLGLDGSTKNALSVASTLASAVTSGATDITVQTGDGANFSQGDYVVIDVNNDDHALVRKVSSVNVNTLTLDVAINENISAGAAVRKVNSVGVGSKEEQPFLSAKIVGKIANNDQVMIYIPKLRIQRGFNLAFSTQDYGNLPFEFAVYDLVSTDPNYAWFEGDSARIFRT